MKMMEYQTIIFLSSTIKWDIYGRRLPGNEMETPLNLEPSEIERDNTIGRGDVGFQ